jgi:2-aminoadipate transaminase
MVPPGLQLSSISFSRCGERLAPPAIADLMAKALETPGLLSLAAGFTDTATLPVEALRAAYENLASRPGPPEFLQYGTNQGRPLLRALLARRLAGQERMPEAGLSPERLFIVNGSQQALALASQVLCDPGDIVLVEEPTYFVYLDVLRGLGVRPVSLPLDSSNRIDPEGVEKLLWELERSGNLPRIKAVYLVSYFANPSSRTLGEEEKRAVAEILARRGLRLPIIEDAAYRELYYRSPPVSPSSLNLETFAGFPRLYLGTLTKPFATGLKIGFGYCTSREWLDRILYLKGQHDFGSSNFAQALLEEILANGAFEQHLVRLRANYERKMRALNEVLLEENLPGLGWRWEVPEGGLYLWLRGPDGLDTRSGKPFCRRCLARGVLYVPGDLCFGDRLETRYLRLSFGVLSPDDLREAARRFVAAAREASAG